MEIRHIEFEEQLALTIGEHQITLTAFLTNEPGTIKFGIDAPWGLAVNREEVYKRKQEPKQPKQLDADCIDYPKKIKDVFTELLTISHKSEKLEAAAKQLFNKIKILTPTTITNIAQGEPTTRWIVACAIDILLSERPHTIHKVLSHNELFILWAKPLLHQAVDKNAIVKKAQSLNSPALTERIQNYLSRIK